MMNSFDAIRSIFCCAAGLYILLSFFFIIEVLTVYVLDTMESVEQCSGECTGQSSERGHLPGYAVQYTCETADFLN